MGTIGVNKVGVPKHLYKIVYDPNKKEAIAFLMPNKALKNILNAKIHSAYKRYRSNNGP
jgi:hypothetical protein